MIEQGPRSPDKSFRRARFLALPVLAALAVFACRAAEVEEIPYTPKPETNSDNFNSDCTFRAEDRLLVKFEGDPVSDDQLPQTVRDILAQYEVQRIESETQDRLPQEPWRFQVNPETSGALKEALMATGEVEYAEEDTLAFTPPTLPECTPMPSS